MKLTRNEKHALTQITINPHIASRELAVQMGISVQAVGKIKKSLKQKGLIDRYETVLNYPKMGITFFVLTLVKIMPRAFRSHKKDIHAILSHPNIITLINVPQTNITNIVLFGFRDVSEYSNFFSIIQSKLPGFIEIKESYVFSSENLVKNSAKDLFLSLIPYLGDETYERPKPSLIRQEPKSLGKK